MGRERVDGFSRLDGISELEVIVFPHVSLCASLEKVRKKKYNKLSWFCAFLLVHV